MIYQVSSPKTQQMKFQMGKRSMGRYSNNLAQNSSIAPSYDMNQYTKSERVNTHITRHSNMRGGTALDKQKFINKDLMFGPPRVENYTPACHSRIEH